MAVVTRIQIYFRKKPKDQNRLQTLAVNFHIMGSGISKSNEKQSKKEVESHI